MKPMHRLSPPFIDPPEPEPWQEAEAERLEHEATLAAEATGLPEAFGLTPAGAAEIDIARREIANAAHRCVDSIVEARSMLGFELSVALRLAERNEHEALNAFKMIDAAVKQLRYTINQTRPAEERAA